MIAMILYLALTAHMGEPNKFQFPDWIAVVPDQRSAYLDVPAIEEERPSPHPCNLSRGPFSVCITGPEKVWTCQDKARVLLTSEDGVRHCIRF